MNKPALYENNNHLERSGVEKVLQEFAHIFQWRSDGRDSVLDAGCGPGDTTLQLLLPILPPNFKRVVGVDISEEMVTYARKKYIHPKVSFEQFNLAVKLEKQSLNGIEPFDHITSFYCLMFLQDHTICLQNFYKLLKPGGDMLLVFLAENILKDIYEQQSQDPRWAVYMNDLQKKYSIDEYRNLLTICGFKDCDVKLQDEAYIFNGVEKLQDFILATNKYFDRIPANDKQAYLDDIVKHFVERGCALDDFTKDTKTCRIKLPYTLLVAYARK